MGHFMQDKVALVPGQAAPQIKRPMPRTATDESVEASAGDLPELTINIRGVDAVGGKTLRLMLAAPMNSAMLDIGTIDVEQCTSSGLYASKGESMAFSIPDIYSTIATLTDDDDAYSSSLNRWTLCVDCHVSTDDNPADDVARALIPLADGMRSEKWYQLTLTEAARNGRRTSRLLGRGVHIEVAAGAADDEDESDCDNSSVVSTPQGSPNISTSKSKKGVIAAYYRLRSVAKMIQNNMGWVASGVERVKNFVLWAQPRKTQQLLYLCVFLFFLFLIIPSRYILLLELWREFIEPMFEPGTLIRRSKFFIAQTPNDEHFRKMLSKGGAIYDLLRSEGNSEASVISKPIPIKLGARVEGSLQLGDASFARADTSFSSSPPRTRSPSPSPSLDSPLPFEAGSVLHEGYLRKRGQKYHTWKRRYFVLTDPGMFWIYKNKDAKENSTKGWIGSLSVSHVDAAINPSMMKGELTGDAEGCEDVGLSFFGVEGSYKRGKGSVESTVMYLAADGENEKVNWLCALSGFIERPSIRRTSTY